MIIALYIVLGVFVVGFCVWIFADSIAEWNAQDEEDRRHE